MALLPVNDALDAVLSRVRPLGAERVGLLDAVGRVLAERVTASRGLPAWDNSAMDGYAVRLADVPTLGTALPVATAVAAGDRGDAAPRAGHRRAHLHGRTAAARRGRDRHPGGHRAEHERRAA